MKIHFCTENPYPVQDKEHAEIYNTGFSISEFGPLLTNDDKPLFSEYHVCIQCHGKNFPYVCCEECKDVSPSCLERYKHNKKNKQ